MNTALRAEETKAMIFISEAHEKLKEVRLEDWMNAEDSIDGNKEHN